MFNFKGRVAVVTGASAGLGAHYAEVFAREGANVAICARRLAKLEQVKKKVESYGVECLAVECDVTDADSVKNFVKATYEKFGKVDILVTNAGGGNCSPLTEITDEAFFKTIDLDLIATVRCVKEFGREMIKAGYGRIITIGSSLACGGSMDMAISDYGTAKGGVVNFTRCAAAEWAKTGVTVNCMCPGFLQSEVNSAEAMEAMAPMIAMRCPTGKPQDPSELDSTLLYLSAEESKSVIGAIIHVDGGWYCI